MEKRRTPGAHKQLGGLLFKFDREKLLKLAKRAKSLGVELFVLDDGWFGARDSDTAGLGDYDVNLKSCPAGLRNLPTALKSWA